MERVKNLCIVSLFFCSALVLAGCASKVTRFGEGERVNLARAARLSESQAIEIAERSLTANPTAAPENRPGYVVRATISERDAINEWVKTLDRELVVGMLPACIPQYEVRFLLSAGTVASFGYMCHNDRPWLISGSLSDGSFRLGGEVQAPDEFKVLLDRAVQVKPLTFAPAEGTQAGILSERQVEGARRAEPGKPTQVMLGNDKLTSTINETKSTSGHKL